MMQKTLLAAVCLVMACAWAQAATSNARDILLLTDMDFCPMAHSLLRLYPERVQVHNVLSSPCPGVAQREVGYVISMLTRPENTSELDRKLFENALRDGLTVITGLDEYAWLRGCRVEGSPIRAVYRELDPASFR